MPLEPRFLRLAERFIDFVKRETGLNTIVCDETGTIVRATIRSRIGNKHAGAQRIMRNEVDEAAITAEMERANPLTKEGLNCPIVVDGRRVGTFGIAGALETTRPLARVASVVLATWFKELQQETALHETAARVFAGVDGLARQVGESAATAQAIAEEMSGAASEAVERVERAEVVVNTVQRIAQQSRILSINGSVEATRAGDQGRAFAVVAKDMTKLAEETKAAAAAVQTTLGEIARAVARLRKAVSRTTAAAAEQAKSLQEVTHTVATLKEAMVGLEHTFGVDASGADTSKRRER